MSRSIAGRRRAAVVGLAAGVLLAGFAPSAGAKVSFERIEGFPAAGTPAKYNKVGILKVGSPRAKNVLVLNPGTSASAAYFGPLARTVARQAPGWQVWAVNRRENLLEDHSVANLAKTGKASGQRLFDYYLGYLTDPAVTDHYTAVPDSAVPFAREWGMRVSVEDLRRVVRKAQRRGGEVVVGGHSLGGSITTAYATWDFNGRAGASGLGGLVYIDGGSNPEPVTPEQATQSLQELAGESPWLAFGGISAPFAGLFNIVGSTLARVEPDAPSPLQDWPLLPGNLNAPVRVIERGRLRLLARQQQLAAQPRRRAGPSRPSGRCRRSARLGAGRGAHSGAALRGHVLRCRAEEPGRHRLVSPAPPLDRLRRRGCRQCEPGAAGARPAGHPR